MVLQLTSSRECQRRRNSLREKLGSGPAPGRVRRPPGPGLRVAGDGHGHGGGNGDSGWGQLEAESLTIRVRLGLGATQGLSGCQPAIDSECLRVGANQGTRAAVAVAQPASPGRGRGPCSSCIRCPATVSLRPRPPESMARTLPSHGQLGKSDSEGRSGGLGLEVRYDDRAPATDQLLRRSVTAEPAAAADPSQRLLSPPASLRRGGYSWGGSRRHATPAGRPRASRD
jgi:hypothetical protein